MTERRSRIGFAALAASFVTALLDRVVPAWDYVFQPNGVAFQGYDAWFHRRVAENLTRNFPWRMEMAPYGLIPGGQTANTGPLLDYLIAGAAGLLGLGEPSEQLIHTVGALTPSVAGALITIPVYSIAQRLVYDASAPSADEPAVRIFEYRGER